MYRPLFNTIEATVTVCRPEIRKSLVGPGGRCLLEIALSARLIVELSVWVVATYFIAMILHLELIRNSFI